MNHRGLLTIVLAGVIGLILFSAVTPFLAAAQDPIQPDLDAAVEAKFLELTPAERVGQLFLVSFEGNSANTDSDIAELIQEYRVGGVVISARNRNFFNSINTPAQVLGLTTSLQRLATQPPLPVTATQTITAAAPLTTPYTALPLFVAVAHEGDGYPFTQIRQGMHDIPSQMALAATWDLENPRQIGLAVGQELSAVGVNMLFGPSLDVLDNPRPNLGSGLGVRTFGSNPYWVGEMGHAYIQGIHLGSDGKLLTIAKHFPGFGSSDREINQGVPTILKSLDDMRRTELPPFFRVTNLNDDTLTGVTDGLMTAHARYQGLQGNVPVSLDARNLPALLALKEIAPWRQNGGLVVSAPLGAPAALEGISAGRDNFPARRLVQDAFLAGNDVLYLGDFAYPTASEIVRIANIKDAIGFFQEKYATDPNFQTAVDQRVRRILRAKMRLYGPDLAGVPTLPLEEMLAALNAVTVDLNQIAQAGVTLITPATGEGRALLPEPPQPTENILIFMDDRQGQDCASCASFPLIEVTALEERILQLFGPNATGQISPEQINSIGFSQLKAALDGASQPAPEAEAGEQDAAAAGVITSTTVITSVNSETQALIDAADWILFGMLNIDPDAAPDSDSMRLLFRNRFDSLRNKKLVLFAFNAPYFLDETEISQLTAYYGLYSKTAPSIEAAARVLFQQFEPTGASPVAIPAIGPLNLSPDPAQVIDLTPLATLDTNGNSTAIETPPESDTLDLSVGEGIIFTTGQIVDRNGHPVPDGTVVDFFRYYPLEGLSLEPLQSRTVDGVAEITIVKERDTPLQVRASSNLAVQSVTFNIGPGIVDTPTPTATPTATPTDPPKPYPPESPYPTPEPAPMP